MKNITLIFILIFSTTTICMQKKKEKQARNFDNCIEMTIIPAKKEEQSLLYDYQQYIALQEVITLYDTTFDNDKDKILWNHYDSDSKFAIDKGLLILTEETCALHVAKSFSDNEKWNVITTLSLISTWGQFRIITTKNSKQELATLQDKIAQHMTTKDISRDKKTIESINGVPIPQFDPSLLRKQSKKQRAEAKKAIQELQSIYSDGGNHAKQIIHTQLKQHDTNFPLPLVNIIADYLHASPFSRPSQGSK